MPFLIESEIDRRVSARPTAKRQMSARVRLDHDRISFRRLRDLRALRVEHLPGRPALPRAIQRQPVRGKNEQRHLLYLQGMSGLRRHGQQMPALPGPAIGCGTRSSNIKPARENPAFDANRFNSSVKHIAATRRAVPCSENASRQKNSINGNSKETRRQDASVTNKGQFNGNDAHREALTKYVRNGGRYEGHDKTENDCLFSRRGILCGP
jgi:hypothetical protein